MRVDFIYDVDKYGTDMFVYFLIDDEKIVYVGKTTQGLTRPFSHREKQFDRVGVIYTKTVDELANLESELIIKYKPKYNKVCQHIKTLRNVKKFVSDELNDKFTVAQIKRAIRYAHIEYVEHSGIVGINKKDLMTVCWACIELYHNNRNNGGF